MRPVRRDARRNFARSESVADQLIAKYGGVRGENRRPELPNPNDMRGMGDLVWLEVRPLNNKRKFEYWDFAERNRPQLGFDNSTGHPYHVGGCYRVDGTGFHNSNVCGIDVKLSPVERRNLRNRAAIADHLENHEGRDFDHAFSGNIIIPHRFVTVGRARAICYFTDKGNLDKRGRPLGMQRYRHVFGDRHKWWERWEHSPLVDVDIDGSRIHLRYDEDTTAVIERGWFDD